MLAPTDGNSTAWHFKDACYDVTGTKVEQKPCGWSPQLGSSLCCPEDFDCMANGLCRLAANRSVVASNVNFTPDHDILKKGLVAWVQLPSCTSKNHQNCAFNPQSCYTYHSTSSTTGFIPLRGCTSEVTALNTTSWLSCGPPTLDPASLPSCSSANSLMRSFTSLGPVLCPAYRNSTCSELPLGTTDPAFSGAALSNGTNTPSPDDPGRAKFPTVFIYPIVIFAALIAILVAVWYLRRRRARNAESPSVSRQADPEDQGLPPYEEHWRSGRPAPDTSEWPGLRPEGAGRVWLEPPPEYVAKREDEPPVVAQSSELGLNAEAAIAAAEASTDTGESSTQNAHPEMSTRTEQGVAEQRREGEARRSWASEDLFRPNFSPVLGPPETARGSGLGTR